MRVSQLAILLCLFPGMRTLPSDQKQPTSETKPIRGPLSPKESLKHFRLAPGLRMELVASEPQIVDPVAMAFDEDGKLWVVEMRDYPNGPPPGKPPQGRIKILEDRNGDGFYEHSRVFADHLLFANGLLHWNGGVVVTKAPEIVYLRDGDGDGKADAPVREAAVKKDGVLQLTKSQVLFEGFAEKNPQLRVSHPKLGIDGWIYVANGLRGGEVKRIGNKHLGPINISGLDFRFNLITDRYESISGMGQFGNCFDDWGHRFVCDNRHHLRHVVFPNRYVGRNSSLAISQTLEDTSVLDDGPLSSGGKIYPLSKNWTTSNLHAGRFTAACGVHVYRGDLLAKEFQGCACTCDPTGNLVHREILEQHGATFRSRPARKGVEFLATPDEWFRPVYLTEGPDGAMYVADVYRAVIEHPQFMPTELKQRPDLYKGNDKGRIWRIVPEKHKTNAMRPNLTKASTKKLVELLGHPNAWWRETAQRLLIERRDPKTAQHLVDTCKSSKSAQARAHALWLLENFKVLQQDVLLRLLRDEHPRVREQAVRIAERGIGKLPQVEKVLVELAGDKDPQVRFQLALSLGEWNDPRMIAPLAKIAVASLEDPWTRKAVLSLPPGYLDKLTAELFRHPNGVAKKSTAAHRALLVELMETVGAGNDAKQIGSVLQLLFASVKEVPARMTALGGLISGLERRGTRLTSLQKQLPDAVRKSLRQALEQAKDVALDPFRKRAIVERVTALRLLAHDEWKNVKTTLTSLFEEDEDQQIRIAAVRAASGFSAAEIPQTIMKSWKSHTPALRREITDAMLRRTDRILYLLKEIEEKRVQPGDVDRLRTGRLLRHSRPEIRTKAAKLLSQGVSEDRKKVLARYQEALKLKGDAKRGRIVFEKTCATCHRVGGIGVDVGPAISDTRTKTPQSLLTDILNPNQAIDNNYVSYQINTRRGQSMTGIIVTETASSVTLKEAENKTHVVLRKDIEEIRSNGISLMPEGVEKNVDLQQMADLISFLKNWRYLDGTIPIPEGGNKVDPN